MLVCTTKGTGIKSKGKQIQEHTKWTLSFFVFFRGISSFYPRCRCVKSTDKEINTLNHLVFSELLVAYYLFFSLLSCIVLVHFWGDERRMSHAEVIFYDSVHARLRLKPVWAGHDGVQLLFWSLLRCFIVECDRGSVCGEKVERLPSVSVQTDCALCSIDSPL